MDATLSDFLDRLAASDGFPALSEAKVASLAAPDRCVVISEADGIVALGAIAEHAHADGSTHVAAETAVEPSLRFGEFEAMVLEATLSLVSGDYPVTVWSRRPSLDRALERGGWRCARTLLEMEVDLPLSNQNLESFDVRIFGHGDEDLLVRLNAEAFSDHREAGSLDRDELDRIASQPWFDPNGILFAEVGGEPAAFCWTKVHPNGEGEIYRIGVGAEHRGSRLGSRIVSAGFADLATRRGCTKGFLWVEAANEAAVRLYRGIGMTERSANREFVRETKKT